MLSNDAKAEAGRASTATTFSYVGEAATVKLTGEWDWDAPVDMNLSGGVWSVDVELSEGLYCYKFIVDGAFIMDPSNPERIYWTASRTHCFGYATISVPPSRPR